MSVDAANTSITTMGCSPLKLTRISSKDRLGYGKRQISWCPKKDTKLSCSSPSRQSWVQNLKLRSDDLIISTVSESKCSCTWVRMEEPPSDISSFIPGQYVTAVYDEDWYLDSVLEISEPNADIMISFMSRSQGNPPTFKWPRHPDKCYIPVTHILCRTPIPSASATGRCYSFGEATIKSITDSFEQFKSHNYRGIWYLIDCSQYTPDWCFVLKWMFVHLNFP